MLQLKDMGSESLTIETLKKASFTSQQVAVLTLAFEKDKITFNESLISKFETTLIKWIVGSMMVLLGLMYAFIYNPLNQKISSVETSLNQKISSVETSLNQRIDDLNLNLQRQQWHYA